MGICTQYLLPLLCTATAIFQSNAQKEDYYCGTDFISAGEYCALPCPSGSDSDCSNALGPEYVCFYFTGCAEKIANGFVPESLATEGADVSTPAPIETTVVTPAPVETSVVTPAPTNAVETEQPTPVPTAAAVETESPTVVVETPAPTAEAETSAPTPSPQAPIESVPTPKPTMRTKRPTPPPAPLVANPTTPQPVASLPQTSSPTTKRPTSAPTLGTIETISTATTDELNLSSSTTSTCYGFIFSLRSMSESPVVEVKSIDFLTASTDALKFELYTKEGAYSGFEGNYGRWLLMGKGLIQGQGSGSYTSITSDLISSVPVDGLGSTRSFYLTLSTKDMIYRTTASGSAPDEAVQQSSSTLELYEGESVQVFPFPMSGTDGAYIGPSQFIGAIYYDVLPCKPLEKYGVIYTLPCPIVPTISPAPSSEAPTIPPSPAPTTSKNPSMTPTYYLTPEPSYMPTTTSPTISPPPTASPTDPPKEASNTEVNIVLVMRNTLNRNMTAEEEKSFKGNLLPFLKTGLSLQGDGVRVEKLDIWYQEQVDWSQRRLRDLQENQLASTAVTLILGVAYYESPDENVSDIVVDFVAKAEVSIINLFRGNDENVFLYQIDALEARAIDQVTLSPVAAPVSVEQTQRSVDKVDATSGGISGGTYAGIGIGVVAACIIAVGSSCYIFKKRYGTRPISKRMLEIEEVEEDLEAGPLDSSRCVSKKSSKKSSLQGSNTSRSSSKKSKGLNDSNTSRRNSFNGDDDSSDSSQSSDNSNNEPNNSRLRDSKKTSLQRSNTSRGSDKKSKGLKDSNTSRRNSSKCNDDSSDSSQSSVPAKTIDDIIADSDRVTSKKSRSHSSSSSDSSSDSDSESSSSSEDSQLMRKVQQRRLDRAESNMALARGEEVNEKRNTILTGLTIGVNVEDDTSVEAPSQPVQSNKLGDQSKTDKWKKLSKSVATASKVSRSMKQHSKSSEVAGVGQDSGIDKNVSTKDNWKKLSKSVTTASKLSGSMEQHSKSSEVAGVGQDSGVDKNVSTKDNWKKLSKSVTTAAKHSGSMEQHTKSSEVAGVGQDSDVDKNVSTKDNWKKLSKSVTTAAKLSGSMKHHRTVSCDDTNLEEVNHTQLNKSKRAAGELNDSYQDVNMTVSSNVRGSARRDAKRRQNRSQSLTTPKNSDSLRKSLDESKTRKSKGLCSSSQDELGLCTTSINGDANGELHSSGKRDHWKGLKSSLKDKQDEAIKKDNWKNLSDSVIAKAAEETNGKSERLKSSLKDQEEKADVRKSKARAKDDLRQSRRASSDRPQSRVRRRISSEDFNASADLRKSSKQSSSKRSSDDLRKSRRASGDDDVRKVTRSRTYGSSDDLRQSKKWSDDLRQSKKDAPRRARGPSEDFNASAPLRKSMSSTEDLRKSSKQRRSSEDLRKSRRASVDDDVKKLSRSRKESSDDLRKSKPTQRLNSM